MSWKTLIAAVAVAVGFSTLAPAEFAAADTQIASDGFGRTVANGLGTADAGGAWTIGGTASSFSVGSGVAALKVAAGKTLSAYLNGASTRDTDVTTTVRFSKLPVSGSLYASVVARRTGTHDSSSTAVVAT